MFISLLFVLNSATSYILPTKFSKWKPVHVDNLKCPRYDQRGKVNFTMKMGFLESMQVIKMVDGHLIHKVAYETICNEGFFGSKELTYVIHKPDIEEKDLNGPFNDPFFPAPECSWESRKTHIREFIFKESHPIRMDIYDGSFISPMFPEGKCHHFGCLTIHSNVYWKPEMPAERSCPTVVEEIVDVTLLDGEFHLRIPDTGSFPLRTICKLDFCMKTGIKLDTGEWISVSKDGLEKLDVSDCIDKSIQMRHEIDAKEHTRLTALGHIRTVSCMESISRMSTSSKVNHLDLSKFAPIRSGTGKAYRYCNGQLEETLAIYQDILPEQIPISARKCGFNGVYWEKTWMIPQKSVLGEESRATMIRKMVFNSVKHPTIRVISKKTHSENWSIGSNNFVEEMEGYTKYLVIGGIALLMLLVMIGCFVYKSHRPPVHL